MIINITPQDIWDEFVYYRKAGKTATAFKHIRQYDNPAEWDGLIAGIAQHKYDVKIGDVVQVPGTEISFEWDQSLDAICSTAPDWATPRKRIHSV